MTPEERAKEIVRQAGGICLVGPGVTSHERTFCDCVVQAMIATAIREAVAAEREACAKVAEEYDNGRRVPDFNGEISESVSGRKIATAIRSRSKEGGEG